jgi:hypothetical protein
MILVLFLQPPVLKTPQCLRSSSVIFSSKGKKEKTNKQTNKNPKFKCNTVSVSPSASSPSSVIVSSKKRKKKGVWRQLCECLFEAEAHLPSTVSHLLLHAPFVFSSIQPYPPFTIAFFFFLI